MATPGPSYRKNPQFQTSPACGADPLCMCGGWSTGSLPYIPAPSGRDSLRSGPEDPALDSGMESPALPLLVTLGKLFQSQDL